MQCYLCGGYNLGVERRCNMMAHQSQANPTGLLGFACLILLVVIVGLVVWYVLYKRRCVRTTGMIVSQKQVSLSGAWFYVPVVQFKYNGVDYEEPAYEVGLYFPDRYGRRFEVGKVITIEFVEKQLNRFDRHGVSIVKDIISGYRR
jgi:hypothetical protein